MNMNMNSSSQQKLRTFSPLILFHDHQFIKEETGRLERICIEGRDQFRRHLIEAHKKRILQMLDDNGRYWTDIRAYRSTGGSIKCGSRRSSISSGRDNDNDNGNNKNKNKNNNNNSNSNSNNLKQSPPNTPPLYSHGTISPTTSSRTRYYVHPYRHHPPPQVRRASLINYPMSSATAGPVVGLARVSDNASTSSSSSVPPSPISPEPSTRNLMHAKPHGPAKRRRGNLPKHVTAILRDWLARHKKHPYPTEEEKAALAAETNLTLSQISNWFINARRRILQPMIMKEQQERMLGHLADDDDDDGDNQFAGLDILPYIGDHQRPGSPRQGYRKSHHLVASSRYSPVSRRRAALRRR